MLSCEIISVGTELLLGDILDTNAQVLSKELASMGIAVRHRSTVGDNAQRLAKQVRDALSENDIVLLTGGLGPTADDITKEVCAEVMGFTLERDERAVREIENYILKKYNTMPQSNLKQADLPKGGTIFYNENGTAPGMAMERDGKCVILLPGPPNEMVPMFNGQVKPFLLRNTSGVIVSHTVRTMGIGESAMAEICEDLLMGENPTVAPYAKTGEALLRVTAFAENEAAAEEKMKPVLSDITSRLQPYIYGIDKDSIQQAVVEELLRKRMHIATAESCTAGYISKRITEIPGASEVFDCGVVSYSNEIKMKLLGVREETLRAYGAVSEQTALEMAEGVRKLSGADIGVSVTGVAGPGGSEHKPAGCSYIGIADKDGVRAVRFETGRDDREYNRYVTGSKALHLAWTSIQKYDEVNEDA